MEFVEDVDFHVGVDAELEVEVCGESEHFSPLGVVDWVVDVGVDFLEALVLELLALLHFDLHLLLHLEEVLLDCSELVVDCFQAEKL